MTAQPFEDRVSLPYWSAFSGIYRITTPSGKFYIGSAVNFGSRWSVHRHHLKNGTHHNRMLQAAFNKYGDVLVYEPFLVCDREDLIAFEQIAIDDLQPTLNVVKLAGSSLGYRFTDEQKAKLKFRRKANMTADVRRRIGDASRGKTLSEEHKEKIRRTLTGTKRPPEAIEAMRLSQIGKLNRGPSMPVRCIETGVIYPSSAEAARQLTISRGVGNCYGTYISGAVSGKFKNAYGYTWEPVS